VQAGFVKVVFNSRILIVEESKFKVKEVGLFSFKRGGGGVIFSKDQGLTEIEGRFNECSWNA